MPKMNCCLIATIALAVVLQGCALAPQNIRIDPNFDLPPSMVGSPKPIVVAVADTREAKKLGEVGDPNREMYDVSVNEDPSPAIYRSVSSALSKLGYEVVAYSPGGKDADLTIELQTLKLDSDKRAFDFLTTLNAEVVAHARSANEFFDRKYLVRQQMNTAGPAYARDSSRLVNTAISAALQDMLSDQQLLDVLNK
jgi:uncharacterized lipoprotein YajG